jgi:hypothetical protein
LDLYYSLLSVSTCRVLLDGHIITVIPIFSEKCSKRLLMNNAPNLEHRNDIRPSKCIRWDVLRSKIAHTD